MTLYIKSQSKTLSKNPSQVQNKSQIKNESKIQSKRSSKIPSKRPSKIPSNHPSNVNSRNPSLIPSGINQIQNPNFQIPEQEIKNDSNDGVAGFIKHLIQMCSNAFTSKSRIDTENKDSITDTDVEYFDKISK